MSNGDGILAEVLVRYRSRDMPALPAVLLQLPAMSATAARDSGAEPADLRARRGDASAAAQRPEPGRLAALAAAADAHGRAPTARLPLRALGLQRQVRGGAQERPRSSVPVQLRQRGAARAGRRTRPAGRTRLPVRGSRLQRAAVPLAPAQSRGHLHLQGPRAVARGRPRPLQVRVRRLQRAPGPPPPVPARGRVHLREPRATAVERRAGRGTRRLPLPVGRLQRASASLAPPGPRGHLHLQGSPRPELLGRGARPASRTWLSSPGRPAVPRGRLSIPRFRLRFADAALASKGPRASVFFSQTVDINVSPSRFSARACLTLSNKRY